ncbi:hypothetical protein DKX38_025037 [Salix brachista]|uniref:Complex 1 LYR protein domain-containing protein n=1 Tax=Salix brachista TaxID=2182728 RepID=A0A5N5JMY6_9ROSI|nr:hypothetical protein DKX38_025037 [Salix brachista]
MQKALRVYGQVMRLVRRLPKDSRPYYAKFARENFVNYRDVDVNDTQFLDELFLRAYNTPCGFSTRPFISMSSSTASFLSAAPPISAALPFLLLSSSPLSWLGLLQRYIDLVQYSAGESTANKLKEICCG